MRVSKSPEIRRKELMDVSEELFLEKGYENVEVSSIVKKVGVAQGTFYYYFKSKEAVLDAIIDQYISILVKNMEKIANQKHINSIEKLLKMFPFSFSFPGGHDGLMNQLRDEQNIKLRKKLDQRFPLETIGLFTHIIEQGIEEGVFQTEFPEEAARAYIGAASFVLQDINNLEPYSEEFKRKFMAISYFTERILGIPNGTIMKYFIEKNKPI